MNLGIHEYFDLDFLEETLKMKKKKKKKIVSINLFNLYLILIALDIFKYFIVIEFYKKMIKKNTFCGVLGGEVN